MLNNRSFCSGGESAQRLFEPCSVILPCGNYWLAEVSHFADFLTVNNIDWTNGVLRKHSQHSSQPCDSRDRLLLNSWYIRGILLCEIIRSKHCNIYCKTSLEIHVSINSDDKSTPWRKQDFPADIPHTGKAVTLLSHLALCCWSICLQTPFHLIGQASRGLFYVAIYTNHNVWGPPLNVSWTSLEILLHDLISAGVMQIWCIFLRTVFEQFSQHVNM